MTVQTTHRLDARGLACPMPIVKTAQAIAGLASGELLEVLATDPGSTKDFVAWARTTGNELVEQSQEDGVFRFLLRRK
jgi:tRNA 2-thiouridine synthesizing protein A